MKPPCSVVGCLESHVARGFCSTHYARTRSGTPLDQPIERHRTTDQIEYEVLAVLATGETSPTVVHEATRVAHATIQRIAAAAGYELNRTECSVCSSPNCERINLELLQGVSAPQVGQWCGIAPSVLNRHRADHLRSGPGRGSHSWMPPCVICTHPDIDEVSEILGSSGRKRPNGTYARIAEMTGATRNQVKEHAGRHHGNPEHAARMALYEIRRLAALTEVVTR